MLKLCMVFLSVFEVGSKLGQARESVVGASRNKHAKESLERVSKISIPIAQPGSVLNYIQDESKRNKRLLLLFALCCGIIVLDLTLAYPKVETIVNGSSSEVAINPHPPILAVNVEARILADTGSLKVSELFLAPAKPEALQAGFHRKLMRGLKVYDLENKEFGYTEVRAFVAESTDEGSHWEDFKELQIESTDEGPLKKVRMYAPGIEKTKEPDPVIPEFVLNPDATHYLLRFEYSLNNAYAIQETEAGAQAIYEWHVLCCSLCTQPGTLRTLSIITKLNQRKMFLKFILSLPCYRQAQIILVKQFASKQGTPIRIIL